MANTDQAARIATNANALGHDTITAAVAASMVTGRQWAALCFWCAEAHDGGQGEAHRVPGCCGRCAYHGRDAFIVAA